MSSRNCHSSPKLIHCQFCAGRIRVTAGAGVISDVPAAIGVAAWSVAGMAFSRGGFATIMGLLFRKRDLGCPTPNAGVGISPGKAKGNLRESVGATRPSDAQA